MNDTMLPSVLTEGLQIPLHVCSNGTPQDNSYQKSLLILFTVAFEAAPFSLFGKTILQLTFRVNCSTGSVTLR